MVISFFSFFLSFFFFFFFSFFFFLLFLHFRPPHFFSLGIRYETLNFHLLLHLVPCVRLYGPLWTVSCFPFETANGFLVRCISGTNNSMTNMLVTATCLSNVRLVRDVVSPAVAPFVQEMLGDNLPTKYSSLYFVGFTFSDCHSLDHRRKERVYENVTAVGPFKSGAGGEICFRAVVNRVLVESLGYERNANRNNYTVMLRDGRLGLVKEFVVVGQKLQARIEDLGKKKGHTCGSITKYDLTGTQRTVPVDDIVEGPLMTISCGGFLSLIRHQPSPEAS